MTDTAPERIWAAPEADDPDFWAAGTFCTVDDGGVEYVRADLAVKVRPLMWEGDDGASRAEYRDRHFYTIYHIGNERWVAHETIHGVGRKIGDIHPTLEAAKAAVEADHKRRVMAELILTSPQQGAETSAESDVERLKNAATAVIAQWDSPAWKLTKHTGELIAELRAALAAMGGTE